MLRAAGDNRSGRAASAWVEVDLAAVAHNVATFRRALSRGCRLLAVVKSDGYGHGMLRVARTAMAAGADELVVSNVDEGAALRVAGVHAPILIAGPVGVDEAPLAVQHGLVPTLGGYEAAEAFARATRRRLPVQIEVDTGMSRHGIAPGELPALVATIESRGKLVVAGVFSHFAGTSADDLPELRRQAATFRAAVAQVKELRGVPRHLCNTLGTLVLPDEHLDAVRIGGGLYGLDPLRGRGPLRLRPALQLKARIVGLRTVAAGERVGYGGTFTCRRETRLALLPIGYGDGLLRELWAGAEVLVRGRRAPIVGAISMNQTVVDVTDLPAPVFGEEVVLLGAIGDERIDAADRASAIGSAYEVTALLSPRLPRVFRAAPVAHDRGDGRERSSAPANDRAAGDRAAGDRAAGGRVAGEHNPGAPSPRDARAENGPAQSADGRHALPLDRGAAPLAQREESRGPRR